MTLPFRARRTSPVVLALVAALVSCSSHRQVAFLGDFPLESGDILADCRIGYRTFGTLNSTKTNAVLVTTWFQGTVDDLDYWIGPGRLVDSSKYFVIAVDALGNGRSSSPSTVDASHAFPAFSIGDMVATQHRLLTTHLGLGRLKAVIGESMGGMQALQWAIAYPGFAEKIVSIVGSPQSQPDDRERWRAASATVQQEGAWRRAFGRLRTGSLSAASGELTVDQADYAAQARAIATFDIAAPFDGSLTAAARVVASALFIAYAPDDDVVNPAPSVEFGRAADARLMELRPGCGHQAAACDRARLWSAVSAFLAL